jgi:hypothetical protein
MSLVKKWILAAGLLGFCAASQAVPSGPGLYLVDDTGGASVFVGLSGGSASFTGTVGTWTVALTTGTTLQGGVNPVLDLDIGAAVAGWNTSGSLQIIYSDINFGPTSGTATLSEKGNSLFGSVTASAGSSTANTAFANESNLTGGVGPLSGFLYKGTSTGALNSAGSEYSLAIMATITGGATYLDDIKLSVSSDSITRTPSVPDSGMSLVLLVLGLTALGVFARFRKQASV